MADALQGTWVFNDTITSPIPFDGRGPLIVSMAFESNDDSGNTFENEELVFESLSKDHNRMLYPATDTACLIFSDGSPSVWHSNSFKTIKITSLYSEISTEGAYSVTVEDFLSWLQSNATKLPDTPTYTYTVKSYDGASELATVSAPSITAAQFTDGTLTLTDADGSTHIASWTSAVPEGMKLLGLAYTRGATSADIPIGEAVSVLWEADTVLYEIYAPIVATITYKGSVIAELNSGETKRLLTSGKYLEGDLMVEAEGAEVWDGTGVYIVVPNEYGETIIINTFTEETNEQGATIVI